MEKPKVVVAVSSPMWPGEGRAEMVHTVDDQVEHRRAELSWVIKAPRVQWNNSLGRQWAQHVWKILQARRGPLGRIKKQSPKVVPPCTHLGRHENVPDLSLFPGHPCVPCAQHFLTVATQRNPLGTLESAHTHTRTLESDITNLGAAWGWGATDALLVSLLVENQHIRWTLQKTHITGSVA